MSISFTPGVYKDRADLQRQLDKYYKQLSLQASNNAKIKDIDNNSITRAELKLAPQFTQRNSEDRLKDSSYQRQLAYQKLASIFSPTDTDALLGDLIAKDEILLFNTYADKFFDDYKINENTTTNLFLTNWKLFQQKLNSSDVSMLGNTLTDIKSILEGSQGKLQEAIEEIKRSSLSANEKSDAIKDILMTTYVRGQKKLNDILDSINASSLSANEKSDAIKDILMTTYVRGQKKLNDILDSIKESSLTANEKSEAIKDILTSSYVRNQKKLNEIVAAINTSSLTASERADAIKTAIEVSSLTASEKADAIAANLGKVEAQLGVDSGLSPDALQLALKLAALDNKEVDGAYKATFPQGVPEVPSLYRGQLRYVSKFRFPSDNDEDTMMKRNAILLNSFPDVRDIDWNKIVESQVSFRERQNRNAQELLNESKRTTAVIGNEMQETQRLLKENGVEAKETKQVLQLLRHSNVDQLRELNDSIRDNGLHSRETNKILNVMQEEQKVQTGVLKDLRQGMADVKNILLDNGVTARDTNEILAGLRATTQNGMDQIAARLVDLNVSQGQAQQILMIIGAQLQRFRQSSSDHMKDVKRLLRSNDLQNEEQKQILESIRDVQEQQRQIIYNGLIAAGATTQEITEILRQMQTTAAPVDEQPNTTTIPNNPRDYFRAWVTGFTPNEIKRSFDEVFADDNQVLVYDHQGEIESLRKDLVRSHYYQAMALTLAEFPDATYEDFARMPNIRQRDSSASRRRRPSASTIQTDTTTGSQASAIMEQAMEDVMAGRYNRARQSLASVQFENLDDREQDLYDQILHTLNQRANLNLDPIPEEPASPPQYEADEKKAEEMKFQQRLAEQELERFRNDYRNKVQRTYRSDLTKEFNDLFPDRNDDVYIWHDSENRPVRVKKNSIEGKYYKKIEAILLHKYPLANLSNMDIPDRARGEGLKKIPRRKELGRYKIHIPSLQKGYLYIQYPSSWRIKHFPKQKISSDMCSMMWDLVDEKQFDKKKYNKLAAPERKLYDEIITLTRVKPNEIAGLGMHKTLTDKDRDACLKKLKILTGEISSGNHGKKTIKELKLLLLKMIDKGYISRLDANKLMYQIMVVDE
jgi:hypothetical protein